MEKLLLVAAAALMATAGVIFALAPPAPVVVVTPAENPVQYEFARYNTLGELIGAGANATKRGMAITLCGAALEDGKGGIYVWSPTSTYQTNSIFTVFQASGITTGRWFAINATAFAQGSDIN